MLLSASRLAGSKCTYMAIWICTWEKKTEHEQFIRRLPLSIIPFLLIPVLWMVQEKATWSVTDQDTDQVNGILGWDLDHKPIEQRRAGRDDGIPPVRRIIGRNSTWTYFRKRRTDVKAPIFGLEQFPLTDGNVPGNQTFRCFSRATLRAWFCWLKHTSKSKKAWNKGICEDLEVNPGPRIYLCIL